MEREINDFLQELNSDFSAYSIGRLMKCIGVLEEGDKPEYLPFNQYVFLAYYSMLFEAISPHDVETNDFDENAFRLRGIQKEYIDSIEWISKYLKRDMTYELSRYEKLFEDEYVNSFRNKLDDVLEELTDIKSSKVNTLEILFEAEESESNLTNQEYAYENEMDFNQNETDFTSFKLSGNDPEVLIKLLKRKKGIIVRDIE